MRYINTLLFILFLLPFSSLAQDTLHVGSPFATDLLKLDQTNTYVHYQEFKDGRLLPASLKTITLTRKESELLIIQKEFSARGNKIIETVVDAQSLVTDSHVRTSGEQRESFQFKEEAVTVTPGDEDAVNKDFQLDLSEPTFNFEIDFIFLQAIDWHQHDAVVMNFYHPGGKIPPAYYTFKKEKEETITLASGLEVNTWVIFTDYNGQPPARFWISKESNEILRNETDAMEMAGFKFRKQLIEN